MRNDQIPAAKGQASAGGAPRTRSRDDRARVFVPNRSALARPSFPPPARRRPTISRARSSMARPPVQAYAKNRTETGLCSVRRRYQGDERGHGKHRNCRAEELEPTAMSAPSSHKSRPARFWRDPSYPGSSLAMMTILRPSTSRPAYTTRYGAPGTPAWISSRALIPCSIRRPPQ
jgi:hypothetical protein